MRVVGLRMLAHQVVSIRFHFNHGAIDILSGCQHNSRVYFQRHRAGTVHDNNHAYGLCAAAALGQLRLISFRTVRHGQQHAVGVIQADFPDPEAAFAFRDNLLGDNLAAVRRVNGQGIKLRAALLADELCLRRIRRRQRAATVPDGHRGDIHFRAERGGVSQLGRALIGQQGKIFSGHALTSVRSIRCTAAPE